MTSDMPARTEMSADKKYLEDPRVRPPDGGGLNCEKMLQGSIRTRLRREQRAYAYKLLQEQRRPICGCRLQDLQKAYARSCCSLRTGMVQEGDMPVDRDIALLRISVRRGPDMPVHDDDAEPIAVNLDRGNTSGGNGGVSKTIRCQLLQRVRPVSNEIYAPPRRRLLQYGADGRENRRPASFKETASQTDDGLQDGTSTRRHELANAHDQIKTACQLIARIANGFDDDRIRWRSSADTLQATCEMMRTMCDGIQQSLPSQQQERASSSGTASSGTRMQTAPADDAHRATDDPPGKQPPIGSAATGVRLQTAFAGDAYRTTDDSAGEQPPAGVMEDGSCLEPRLLLSSSAGVHPPVPEHKPTRPVMLSDLADQGKKINKLSGRTPNAARQHQLPLSKWLIGAVGDIVDDLAPDSFHGREDAKMIPRMHDQTRLVLTAGLDAVSCKLKGNSLTWRWTKGAGTMNLIAETLAVWFEEQYQENGWVPELPDACDLLVRTAIGAWLDAVMPLEP